MKKFLYDNAIELLIAAIFFIGVVGACAVAAVEELDKQSMTVHSIDGHTHILLGDKYYHAADCSKCAELNNQVNK